MNPPSPGGLEVSTRALCGKTICLVHRGSLRYASRLVEEIKALQGCGAHVVFLAHHADIDGIPDDVEVVRATAAPSLGQSVAKLRALRICSNLVRNTIRPLYRWRRAPAALETLARSRQIDIVWIVDWPMLRRYGIMARMRRIPIVYETLDLCAAQAHLTARDRVRESRFERLAVRMVQGFITAGEPYADYYQREYNLASRPVVRDNTPSEHVAFPGMSGSPARLVFAGALTHNRNLHGLLEAVALMKPNLTLTLVGENRLGDQLWHAIRDLGIEDIVSIRNPVSPDSLVEVVSRSDVGVVSLEPVSVNEELACTTKLFTYMAAGLAVVGSDLPGIRSVVRRHDIGWLVSDNDPAEWAHVLNEIAAIPSSQIDAYRSRALRAYEAHSWVRQGSRYLSVFSNAAGGSNLPAEDDEQSAKHCASRVDSSQ